MDLEKLIQAGKTKEEILAAVGAAIDEMSKPEPAPEPNPAPAPQPKPQLDLNEVLSKIMDRVEAIENKMNNPEPAPEPKPEPKPEGMGEEAVNKILQKLNLLSENDKIDSNQQIENNLTKHFGSLIGVDIDTGKE